MDLDFLKTVIPAIVTGGGSAIGSSLAFLKDIRSRLTNLEKRVGSKDEATGLSQELVQVKSKLDDLTARVESFSKKETSPSSSNFRPPSYPDGFIPYDLPSRPVSNSTQHRLDELEEDIKRIKQKQAKFVEEQDFEASDRQRGNQIEEIRSSIASLRGLLEGLREGLGIKRGR